jgi:hypothetical protein
MNITFDCPNCRRPARQEFSAERPSVTCPHCRQTVVPPPGSVVGESVAHCLVCPSRDLFVRKDFPQRLGVGLVALGVVGSSVAWYHADLAWTFGILFATALADFVLFWAVGNALMCYRCGAIYRGVADMEAHGPFDLETRERHRQLEARLR